MIALSDSEISSWGGVGGQTRDLLNYTYFSLVRTSFLSIMHRINFSEKFLNTLEWQVQHKKVTHRGERERSSLFPFESFASKDN